MLILLVILLLVFGGGGGYYGYHQWGAGEASVSCCSFCFCSLSLAVGA